MDPSDASNDLESHFQKSLSKLSDSLPWPELKTNIRKSTDQSVWHPLSGTKHGYSLLHAFVESNNLYAITFLLSLDMDVNATTNLGLTPLHIAVRRGNKPMVVLLLEKRGDLFREDSERYTVLGRCIVSGRSNSNTTEILRVLLAWGAKINGFARNGANPTKPLLLAVECGKEALVRTLLDSEGAEIETKDADGSTALILAAQLSRHHETRLLLRRKANPNALNNHAETPLLAAVRARSTEIVRMLLHAGAEMDIRDRDGRTPLFIAASRGLQEIVAEMVERGVSTEAG